MSIRAFKRPTRNNVVIRWDPCLRARLGRATSVATRWKCYFVSSPKGLAIDHSIDSGLKEGKCPSETCGVFRLRRNTERIEGSRQGAEDYRRDNGLYLGWYTDCQPLALRYFEWGRSKHFIGWRSVPFVWRLWLESEAAGHQVLATVRDVRCAFAAVFVRVGKDVEK
jgi:hypothetical protein